jgi:hypothetical protein
MPAAMDVLQKSVFPAFGKELIECRPSMERRLLLEAQRPPKKSNSNKHGPMMASFFERPRVIAMLA